MVYDRDALRGLACFGLGFQIFAMSAEPGLETLTQWTEEELRMLRAALPAEVRAASETVGVSLEQAPSQDGLLGDELGCFEGTAHDEEPDAAYPPIIRLFLANLWDYAGGDEQDFRDEVATTYLHELGHYLGWDEQEIEARGLE
jgi:predicted Zn-dependent protease with MMP-like domain